MAPGVFREGPFIFRFYAGDRGEPPHIHVRHSSGAAAKFWLDQDVSLERNDGMRPQYVRRAQRLIEENRDRCLEKWHDYFAD